MTIGTRLEIERDRMRLTQAELGELCGVHRNTQARYENGERSPDANYLAIAARLGIDVLYVITGSTGLLHGKGGAEMDKHPLDEQVNIFRLVGERNESVGVDMLFIGVWKNQESNSRSVQLTVGSSGGDIGLEISPEGALRLAEGLALHARMLIELNQAAGAR